MELPSSTFGTIKSCLNMCYRLTRLTVTIGYTFFGIFDDTSLWILPKTHDLSLCDTPDKLFYAESETNGRNKNLPCTSNCQNNGCCYTIIWENSLFLTTGQKDTLMSYSHLKIYCIGDTTSQILAL